MATVTEAVTSDDDFKCLRCAALLDAGKFYKCLRFFGWAACGRCGAEYRRKATIGRDDTRPVRNPARKTS